MIHLTHQIPGKRETQPSQNLAKSSKHLLAYFIRPATSPTPNTVPGHTMISIDELRVLYDFPISVYNDLETKMDMFEQAFMHEPMDQEAQDEMETTLKKIPNLKNIMWMLQQYVCILVDTLDILLQKKIRIDELILQNHHPRSRVYERTTESRRAFDARLDGIYRTQLDKIARLNFTADEAEKEGQATLEHMDTYAISSKDRIVCITTISSGLEDVLPEEDDSLVAAFDIRGSASVSTDHTPFFVHEFSLQTLLPHLHRRRRLADFPFNASARYFLVP
jgi:hypothetical protein